VLCGLARCEDLTTKRDRKTNEPILWEIRPTQAGAIGQRVPWRAAVVGIVGVVAIAVLGGSERHVLGVLVVALGVGVLESIGRRDFVTSTRVLRQSGLMGIRAKRFCWLTYGAS
jgi:hypothetical protein